MFKGRSRIYGVDFSGAKDAGVFAFDVRRG